MASKLYSYCMSRPYAWARAKPEDVYILVKKTALNFAMETGEDITEAIETTNEVTKMIVEGYSC